MDDTQGIQDSMGRTWEPCQNPDCKEWVRRDPPDGFMAQVLGGVLHLTGHYTFCLGCGYANRWPAQAQSDSQAAGQDNGQEEPK